MVIHGYKLISTYPRFIDCSNSLRDSLEPRGSDACVEYSCVSPVDDNSKSLLSIVFIITLPVTGYLYFVL